MESKKLLVGLAGKQQMGKTTGSNTIKKLAIKHGLTCTIRPLAYPIKMFSEACGLPMAGIYGSGEDKDMASGLSIMSPLTKELVAPTCRQFQQLFGTEVIRNSFGQGFWVDCFLNYVKNTDYNVYVCDDVRFVNELVGLSVNGMFISKVERDILTSTNHISEREVDKMEEENFCRTFSNLSLIEYEYAVKLWWEEELCPYTNTE